MNLDGSYLITEVVVGSDWWMKRPTQIRVLDDAGNVLGEQTFLTRTTMVCGSNGDELCEYPERPTSLLRIYPDATRPVPNIVIEIDGLLSLDNRYASVKEIDIYGIKAE